MSEFQAQISVLPETNELEALWRTLEVELPGSFFTSWTWIGPWISELADPSACRLVTIRSSGSIVAIGIISVAGRWRHGLYRRMLTLHATGNAESDSVFVEQNGMLGGPGLEDGAYEALFERLDDPSHPWDELEVRGASDERPWLHAARAWGLMTEVESRISPRLDFAPLDGGPLRDAIVDARTRYHLRRAFRDYSEALGEPIAVEPGDADEALACFDEMCGAHQSYWQGKGQPGAFASEKVRRFHHRLIRGGLATGNVRLVRVLAGRVWVGTVYLLVHEKVANYYQSGYDYQALECGNRPGWLCMQVAIDRLRGEGLAALDFLAGSQRYKTMLANNVQKLHWIRCIRPRAHLRLDEFVTRGVRRLRALAGNQRLSRASSQQFETSILDA